MIINAIQRNRQLVREAIGDLTLATAEDHTAALRYMVDYFNRISDTASVRDAMANRYSVGIIEDPDSNTGNYTHGRYDRPEVRARIETGIELAMNLGIGHKLAEARATLFNQPAMTMSVDNEQAQEWLSAIRDAGALQLALERADYMACGIGSAAVHVYWKGEQLEYRELTPDQVWIIHGRSVIDGKIRRPSDKRDLDDAYAVIIDITTDASLYDATHDYLAYIGRCTEHPDGRMVHYRANHYYQIPAVDVKRDPYTYEYTRDNKPCNPLSYALNRDDSLPIVEYPLFVIDGGMVKSPKTCMPWTPSLMDNAIELELAWSQMLKYGLQAARGKDIVHLDSTASGLLPINLDMPVLKTGQKYEHIEGTVQAGAIEMMRAVVVQMSSGYSVPSYLVISEGAPESGVALAIRTRPLIDNRRSRVKLNDGSIRRLYDLERVLSTERYGTAGTPLKDGYVHTWNPGDWHPPQDALTEIQSNQAAEDAGYIDHVEAVRRFHRFATIQQAEELIEQQTERENGLKENGSYGAQQEQQQSPFGGGLLGGMK